MNKGFKSALAVLAAISMAACTSTASSSTASATASAASKTLTAGTYTATATGHNGNVTVEVTVSADSIDDVKVTDSKETAGLADPAIEQIPTWIVENQSISADMVSGATYTSVAIETAVADAITQAGGDPSAWRIKHESSEKGTTEQLSSDVIVIGGGGAGMTATIRLEELGKNVILVEKTSSLGGTIRVSGGNQVVTGSALQQEAGVTDDSAESMEEDFLKNGDNKNDTTLLGIYAENVGETTDWLNQTVGVQFDMETGLHKLAEYSNNRELAYTGGGAGAAVTMADAVDQSGAQVLLNTTATALTVTDGKVTGVTATTTTGKTYELTADSVVLATGGYGNNDDLLPESASEGLFYGLDSSNGSGLLMATADGVDAATVNMDYVKEYPNGIETSKKHAKSTIAGNIAAFGMSAILVNKDGDRVVNEKDSNKNILAALQAQDDQELYLVMDAETYDTWKTKLTGAGISEEFLEQWLQNNGSSEPILTTGSTIEEAAKAAGIDGTELQKTVDTYNGYVASGTDTEFGRSADYMTQSIGDGPYYICEQKARYATTMGGLSVDENLQVVNTSGTAIDGLYAAGEIIGGTMGTDSPSGANNGWAVTSGKYVAEVLAK